MAYTVKYSLLNDISSANLDQLEFDGCTAIQLMSIRVSKNVG